MNAKKVLTISLLMFVAACIAVVTVKALRPAPQPQPAAAGTLASAANVNRPESSAPEGGAVIAYYFHGNVRCPTCRSIEAYAHEAVETGFADQLASGRLTWKVVNYEAAGNEHFAEDYKVIFPTVVLVRTSGASEKEWKNLDRVWELVDDKDAFLEYVRSETATMLKKTAPGKSTG
jgi:hypothetical protein